MGRSAIFLVAAIAISGVAAAQTTVWVNLEKGDALFLNPSTMGWEPLTGKQRIPAKTYAITKHRSRLKVFVRTEVIDAPPASYFFVTDLFPRDRNQLVEELTSIELQQLPSSGRSDTTKPGRTVGLTYGNPDTRGGPDENVAALDERLMAVGWLEDRASFGPALLCLKRTMTSFPVLYLQPALTERLCSLYDRLGLYGFLYEETRRLLETESEGKMVESLTDWNSLAKVKLTGRQETEK